MHSHLILTPDIADALADGRPVVALESTVISHGMPYPKNLATARALEAEVRDSGAFPATIAVMDGRIRIGLDDDALERDRKSTRLNSSHIQKSRMPSSA